MAGVKKGNIPWNKGVTGYKTSKSGGKCDNTGRTHFNMGHIPWNKGKHFVMSEEWKENIRKATVGVDHNNSGYKHTDEWISQRKKWADTHKHILRKAGLAGSMTLRKRNPTNLEVKIGQELDRVGIKHLSQYLINNRFCVDEYLPEHNMVIEVDGKYWHDMDRIIKKDKAENAYLSKCGYRIIRIPEKDVSSFSAASLLSDLMAVNI
ncbi:MAG: DUF559 domain-containing protein [Patescibacteria group bacterium]|jgi:very-short-patch-repair endonuclease